MIYKKIITLLMISSFSFLNASLLNAVAMTVNDKVISLYDIDKKMQTANISKQKAVAILIDDRLYEDLVETLNIGVDNFDVDKYIEQLASNNKMSTFQFKSVIKQKENYENFKSKIKKQLKHQKLLAKIASNKLTRASEEDINLYYENNKESFQIADTISAIQYTSVNKKALLKIPKNPMMSSPAVKVENVKLRQKMMPAQIKFIVNQTAKGKFTSVFAANRTYNLLYITNKENVTVMSYDDAKNKIFGIIMKEREKEYLENYFEELRLKADIRILR